MEEQEQKILELLKDEEYPPMKAKQIAMVMRVPKNEYNEFLNILGISLILSIKLILLFLKLQNSNAGAASTNFFTSLYLLPK